MVSHSVILQLFFNNAASRRPEGVCVCLLHRAWPHVVRNAKTSGLRRAPSECGLAVYAWARQTLATRRAPVGRIHVREGGVGQSVFTSTSTCRSPMEPELPKKSTNTVLAVKLERRPERVPVDGKSLGTRRRGGGQLNRGGVAKSARVPRLG